VADDYITEPGSSFEPGDVFSGVAFPNLRHPFRRYRLSTKPRDKNCPEIFESVAGADKPGDIIHSTFERKTVMLVSHGCELDKVLKLGANAARRHWSCAPIEPFHLDPPQPLVKARQERTRQGTQPNRFYIPPNKFLGDAEHYVELRRITPLPAQYFIEAAKVCSLSDDARDDLYAQMGVNQSGLILYVELIPCPTCGTKIDPKDYMIASTDDAEEDDPE
jgi:hypothetical protein